MQVCPQYEKMGVFTNNIAHSNGFFGLWIYPVYTPKEGLSLQQMKYNIAKHEWGQDSWNIYFDLTNPDDFWHEIARIKI